MFSKGICCVLLASKGSCLWNQYPILLHNSVLYSFLDNSLYLASFASFRVVLRPLVDSISSEEKSSQKKTRELFGRVIEYAVSLATDWLIL